VTLPVTVVLTTNALLGQWQDELAKFAPSLRVRWYYGTTKPKIYADLMNTDVVLSTHGTTMFTDGGHHMGRYIRVHRIIIDECHGRDAIAHATSSLRERATGSESMGGFRFAWGVTGTPLSSSVKDLYQMADLIGQWDGGLQLRKYHDDDSCRSELPGVLWGGIELVLELDKSAAILELSTLSRAISLSSCCIRCSCALFRCSYSRSLRSNSISLSS
jgi:hypothetical protein